MGIVFQTENKAADLSVYITGSTVEGVSNHLFSFESKETQIKRR